MFGHLEWQFNPHDLLKAQSLIIYTSINNWKLLLENKRAINMLATLSVIIQIVEGAYLVWGSDLGIPVVDVLTTNSEMTILRNVIRIVIVEDRPFLRGSLPENSCQQQRLKTTLVQWKSIPDFRVRKKSVLRILPSPLLVKKKTNCPSLETNPYHS